MVPRAVLWKPLQWRGQRQGGAPGPSCCLILSLQTDHSPVSSISVLGVPGSGNKQQITGTKRANIQVTLAFRRNTPGFFQFPKSRWKWKNAIKYLGHWATRLCTSLHAVTPANKTNFFSTHPTWFMKKACCVFFLSSSNMLYAVSLNFCSTWVAFQSFFFFSKKTAYSVFENIKSNNLFWHGLGFCLEMGLYSQAKHTQEQIPAESQGWECLILIHPVVPVP